MINKKRMHFDNQGKRWATEGDPDWEPLWLDDMPFEERVVWFKKKYGR